MWMNLELSDEESALRDLILERGLLPGERLAELLHQREQELRASVTQLAGRLMRSEHEKLVFRRLPDETLLAELALSAKEDLRKTRRWGSKVALIDPDQGRYVRSVPLPEAALPALVSGEELSWLFWDGADQAIELGLTQALLAPEMGQAHGLCDLYVDPDARLLVVSHRLRGTVSLVSLLTQRRLGEVVIREPGSELAINVAIEPGGKRIFLTDNLSPKLHILEVDRLRTMALQTGLGPLGSILMAPDSNHFLYLVSYANQTGPGLELKYFDLESFSVFQELDIKGNSFCRAGRMPADPLMATPDGELVLLMGYMDEPEAFTPVVNVIRAGKVRTVRRYAIKDNPEPWMLATRWYNPLAEASRVRLHELLLEERLLDRTLLRSLQDEIEQRRRESGSYQPPVPHADLGSEVDKALLEREAPPISFSAEADEAIVELLVRAFYQERLTNLRVHPEDLRRLRQVALELRQELESRYAVRARIPHLLGRYTLETLITREAVLSLLEHGLPLSEAPFRPEDLCPMCQALLGPSEAGGMGCGVCGFARSSADVSLRAHCSAEVGSAGVSGQFLISLPQAGKVVLMNHWQHLLWELQSELLSEPVHALPIAGQNVLVTDRAHGRLLEFSPAGNLLWQSRVPMQRPEMASWYQDEGEQILLVADTGGRRVLAFDRKQRILASYGEAPGQELSAPVDVQRTHLRSWLISDSGAGRVLEIDEHGRQIRCFDAAQGLVKPVFARRLLSDLTVIVDAGTASITVFDTAMKPLQRSSYWPPITKANSLAHEPPPERVLRLPHDDLLLIGRSHYMHFSLRLFRSQWVEALPHSRLLRRQTRVFSDNSAVVPEKPAEPAETGYRALLRQIRFLQDADPASLEELVGYLRPVRYRAQQWIMRQGEAARAMYFVLEGQVEIVRDQASLATIRAGDMFGEMALLVGGLRSNSARALSACHMLELSRDDFRRVMARFPELATRIRALAQERRAMSHSVQSSRKTEVMDRLKVQLAVRRLKELPILAGAEASLFEILAQALRPMAFMPDKDVFRKGEPGDALYFISRGQVEVLPDDAAEPAAVLGEGEIFGEMALISQEGRNATVRTRGYCQFLLLESEAFEGICSQFPEFYERLRRLADQREAVNRRQSEQAAAAVPSLQPALRLYQRTGAELGTRRIFCLSPQHEAVFGLMPDGRVAWSFGQTSDRQLFYPSRCSRDGDRLWIADTGNDRILAVSISESRTIGEWGADLGLQQPRSAHRAPDGSLLIADEGNQRLLLLGPTGTLIWEYGAPNEILSPVHAELGPQGTIWFADAALHMVQEINQAGKALWSFGHLLAAGNGPDELCEPGFVQPLADGQVLIADTGNDRVLRVDRLGRIQRTYTGTPDQPLPRPSHCQLLDRDELLVFCPEHERVAHFDAEGQLLWSVEIGHVGGLDPAAALEAQLEHSSKNLEPVG